MTTQRKKTLLVIPAHNEEENIQAVFDSLNRHGVSSFADILVVNDASDDRTAQIIRENGLFCITFTYNLGYGSALQAGYKYAVKHDYDYLIQMDADGQHDACNIRPIYEELIHADQTDIVLASRFLKGSAPYRTGIFMKLGFWWFRVIVQLLGGIRIADSTTGLQGMNRRAFSYYAGFDHFDAAFPDANMILQMALLGFRLKEIPAVMHRREHGKGMHTGVIKPAKYMFRATAAVLAVWFRIVVLYEKGKPAPAAEQEMYHHA